MIKIYFSVCILKEGVVEINKPIEDLKKEYCVGYVLNIKLKSTNNSSAIRGADETVSFNIGCSIVDLCFQMGIFIRKLLKMWRHLNYQEYNAIVAAQTIENLPSFFPTLFTPQVSQSGQGH